MLPVGYLVAVWAGCYDPGYSVGITMGMVHVLGTEIVSLRGGRAAGDDGHAGDDDGSHWSA